MSNKILVLGKGFISDHLPYKKHTNYIICDFKYINSIIDHYKPEKIINCIGKTGRPNVDWCESNQDQTYITNTVLPSILSDICYDRKIHLIHISSGCIFYGDSPNLIKKNNNKIDLGWKENDIANPKSFYSKTKFASDLILKNNPYCSILRIRMPISYMQSNRNLLHKLNNYKKVLDHYNSMTLLGDFINAVNIVIEKQAFGIYHVCNPQPMTPYEIAKLTNKDREISKATATEVDDMMVARRSNCIINSDKIIDLGLNFLPMEETVKKYAYCFNVKK